MEVNQQDIESIFGKPRKTPLLFDEEEYRMLRHHIQGSPRATYDKAKLPFGHLSGFVFDEPPQADAVPSSASSIEQYEPIDSPHPDESASPRVEGAVLWAQIVQPLLDYKLDNELSSQSPTERHVFLIHEPDICCAYGCYDEKTDSFYILKGTRFSKEHSTKYAAASSAATRRRLIRTACKEHRGSYVVTEDFKCRTASSAASVVMGRVSHYAYWKDGKGKFLADMYPHKFQSKAVSSKVIQMNKRL